MGGGHRSRQPTARRNIARRADIPVDTLPLIDLLVQERLLIANMRATSDTASGEEVRESTIEPTHEVLLRQWSMLETWLAADFEPLAMLEAVKRAARDWEANARGDSWLAHQGERLGDAGTLDARPDLAAKIEPLDRAYLDACRAREQRLRDEAKVRQRERDEAQARAIRNESAALVALANAGSTINPTIMTKLALASWPRSPADRRPKLDVAFAALSNAVPDLRERNILRGHHGRVNSAAFSPDGTHVVTASNDKTARIWDAATGKAVAVLSGHNDRLESAAFSPDGARVITASADMTARLWDTATGTEIVVLRGLDGPDVRSGDDSPGIFERLEIGLQHRLRSLEAPVEAPALRAAFSPDGSCIVTTSYGKTARMWEAATGKMIAVLRGHDGPVSNAAFSPDGSRIVTASTDKTARLWDAQTGAAIAVLRGHKEGVLGAVFAPDGARIITVSWDNTARVWISPPSRRRWFGGMNKAIAVLRGHAGLVLGAAFSPDGARVVTASSDRTARIWDAATGKAIAVLRGHLFSVSCATFSRDGSRVVTASSDMTARVWDAPTGEETTVLYGHNEKVNSAAFSPDGARVVTAGDDETARIWDVARGATTAVLSSHTQRVNSAVFSPNGVLLVTASNDETARIWDVATGAAVAVLSGHNERVNLAAFSPDGARVVTASHDETARIWDVATSAAVAVLQRP